MNGPYCATCGLNLQAAATPPVSPYAPPGYVPPTQPQGYPMPPQQPMGYPPPPPQLGYPPPPGGMPYMGPGGQPYMMMPQAQQGLPSKKWAMVGGIMDIVTSSIYLLLGLLAAIGASNERGNDKSELMLGVFIFICLGIAGIIFGVYSTRGRWGGALGGGILHSVFALICFIAIAAVSEAKNKYERDYYYSSSRAKELEAVSGVFVLFALLSTLTAIFCFLGISGAKARARYEQHMRATGAF